MFVLGFMWALEKLVDSFMKCIVLVTLTEPLDSKISPEIPNSKSNYATLLYIAGGVVGGGGGVVGVIVVGVCCYKRNVSIVTIINCFYYCSH